MKSQPPTTQPCHGLAMLQAASLALARIPPSTTTTAPTSTHTLAITHPPLSPVSSAPSTHPSHPPIITNSPSYTSSHPSLSPVSLPALLNPLPVNTLTIPPGHVLGKDGKLKKKRGRKPTPGLTEEDRRQARLLKNRRTAEISRRRKLALMNQLTTQRDVAIAKANALQSHSHFLLSKLATASGMSVEQLVRDDPTLNVQTVINTAEQMGALAHSDVSGPPSVIDSDEDPSGVPSATVTTMATRLASTNTV